MEISPENKTKLDNLKTFFEKAGIHELLPLTETLQEISASLKILAEKELPEMPEQKFPDVQKVEIQGLGFLKGDVGEKGDKGDIGEQGLKGDKGDRGDRGEMGMPGLDGEKGEVGAIGEPGKDGASDTGEQIINKINEDESEVKIKREKVEGLDEEFKKVNKSISSIPRGGGGRASHATKFFKLTPDGTTKTFSVPKSVSSIILMSDFPHVLFEGSANGFTINASRTSITLTTDNAPSVASQLLYQYSEVFNTL